MQYRYKVGGIEKTRGGAFVSISDEVKTSRRDTELALRKARVHHKKASELSVTEIPITKETK
jgi:hypothetical protein